MADIMQEQAEELGAVIDEFDPVEDVRLDGEYKLVETESYIYKAKSLIIATGASPRKLPIPNEGKFAGKGIHYCAVCDGAMYEGKVVGVVGGGNSALEEAIFLTRFAKKVYLIRRYDYFRGEKSLLDQVEKNEKIEILYNEDLVNVEGTNFVEKAIIKNTLTREEKSIDIDGVFGYIGTEPKTDMFGKYINLTKNGYIITDENMNTNIPGVYAAGDVREKLYYIGTEPKTDMFGKYINLTKNGYIITDENMNTNIPGVYAAGDVREKLYRQITTAVADGTIAALEAEKFIISNRSE